MLYRCTKCHQRRALPKAHTDYIRKPKCKACGTPLTYRDAWQEKQNIKNTCNCNGLRYPHRKGSNIFCVESKIEPTNEDFALFYGVKPN